MSPVEVVVVGAVLLVAGYFVVRQIAGQFKQSDKDGCGGSCNCEANKKTGADR